METQEKANPQYGKEKEAQSSQGAAREQPETGRKGKPQEFLHRHIQPPHIVLPGPSSSKLTPSGATGWHQTSDTLMCDV